MDPDRTPVVVAAGQLSSRDRSLGAVELAVHAAAGALSASSRLGGTIERVSVVNILARSGGSAPASELAAALRLRPARCETTTVSGTTPAWLVQRAAAEIAAGRLSATLIAGAEAVRSGRLKPEPRASGAPARPPTPPAGAGDVPRPPDEMVGGDRPGTSDEEFAAGLYVPAYVYPVFESALALRDGRSPAQQRTHIGELLAPFTAVAAKNPHAWFPDERTADELATPSADNRLVAEPYTKLMTAFLGGSQGAAIVVTSLSVARSLAIDDGAMFVRSSATVDDVWAPSARPDLASSPATAAAWRSALEAGGLGLDEVDFIDVYSCFPSAVQIGAEAAGLQTSDPRGLTVTGGLAYFGGPGSNYSTHAIATLLGLLRERGGHGVVTSVGWYLTKHAVACYSATPPPTGFASGDTGGVQALIDATALPVVPRGELLEPQRAIVCGSTVIYGRDGEVSAAPIVATLADGRRVAAAAAADGSDLGAFAGRNLAGMQVEVRGDPPRYRVV